MDTEKKMPEVEMINKIKSAETTKKEKTNLILKLARVGYFHPNANPFRFFNLQQAREVRRDPITELKRRASIG